MSKREKKPSLSNGYLMMTILPLVAVICILSVFVINGYGAMVTDLNVENLETLAEVTLLQFDSAFPGDYALRSVKTAKGEGLELLKGTEVISGKPDYFDTWKEKTGADISLIYADTRIITTFSDKNAARAVGTGVAKQVADAVYGNKGVQKYDNVKIGNQIYITVYLPLSNADGKVVGMLELARTKASVDIEERKVLFSVILIAVLCILFFSVISLRFAGRVLKRIKALELFLTKVAKGELKESLDTEVIKTKDEIGEAGLAAISMQKSIRNLVDKDTLTEIYNRRYATNFLQKVLEKAEVSGQPFAVCIGDIDFFKQVNDTYGHDMGDIVLKEVATLLKNSMIGNGMAARFGGEEFLMIFDKTGKQEGAAILQETLEKLRQIEFTCEDQKFSVTMTFGIVDGNVELGQDALLKLADEKLYDGKQNGRNRVVV